MAHKTKLKEAIIDEDTGRTLYKVTDLITGETQIMDYKEYFRHADDFKKSRYDRLEVFVYKGNREKLKEHAKKQKMQLNGFINKAILEKLERDGTDLFDLPCYRI